MAITERDVLASIEASRREFGRRDPWFVHPDTYRELQAFYAAEFPEKPIVAKWSTMPSRNRAEKRAERRAARRRK